MNMTRDFPDDVDVVDAPTAAPLPLPTNLGGLIDLRADKYARKQELDALLAEVKQEIDELDDAIMAALDEQGTDAARGRKASMSIRETVVPAVKDWDALYEFIKQNGYFHLLNRAPNAAAFRELFTRGEPTPGVEPFTKRALTFRSL